MLCKITHFDIQGAKHSAKHVIRLFQQLFSMNGELKMESQGGRKKRKEKKKGKSSFFYLV
jgi:hypothetical protein